MNTNAENQIWKTIEIGSNPKTITELRNALLTKGINIGSMADPFFNEIEFAKNKIKINLIKKKVKDFCYDGVKKTYAEILSLADTSNLVECQMETALKLCLQNIEYMDDWYFIAMKPKELKEQYSSILRIFWRDGILWLGVASFPPEAKFPMDTILIFQEKKNSESGY